MSSELTIYNLDDKDERIRRLYDEDVVRIEREFCESGDLDMSTTEGFLKYMKCKSKDAFIPLNRGRERERIDNPNKLLRRGDFVAKGGFGNAFLAYILEENTEIEEKLPKCLMKYSLERKNNEMIHELLVNQLVITPAIFRGNKNLALLYSFFSCEPANPRRESQKDKICIDGENLSVFGLFEYVNGSTLYSIIRNLTSIDLINIILQVLGTLGSLQTDNIIYRHLDLNMKNILIENKEKEYTYVFRTDGEVIEKNLKTPKRVVIIDQGAAYVQEKTKIWLPNNKDYIQEWYTEAADIFLFFEKLGYIISNSDFIMFFPNYNNIRDHDYQTYYSNLSEEQKEMIKNTTYYSVYQYFEKLI